MCDLGCCSNSVVELVVVKAAKNLQLHTHKYAMLCTMWWGCLVQVGNGIELEAVGLQFEPYRWRPCGVTWDSSRTVVVIKLRRTSALIQKSFKWYGAVRGMSPRKVTLLGSNLASVTDLKSIQNPHSLCCDFGGYKTFTTRWSLVRQQNSSLSPSFSPYLISPKAVPEGNRRFRRQNQRPSSWG